MSCSLLLAVVSLCASASDTDRPLGESPGLALLSDEVVFYLSFDSDGARADMAIDNPDPVEVKPRVAFRNGIHGQALMSGKGGGCAQYQMKGNLDFTKPGAISFWVSPMRWTKGPDQPLIFFFLAWGKGYIGTERQGALSKNRRSNCFILFMHNFPDIPNRVGCLVDYCTRHWNDGEWHLVVINWKKAIFEMSIDGRRLSSRVLPRALTTNDFSPRSRFQVGNPGQGPDLTLIDEFTVYRRPLGEGEIRELYGAMSGGSR